MRLNKYLASGSTLSRRKADEAVANGRVKVNGQPALTGMDIQSSDTVTLDGRQVTALSTVTILLHKPVGYVVSRNGQGSRTVFELLPANLQHVQAVGRLDKESSGLLLLTNNGQLANELTHPRNEKLKVYKVILDKSLNTKDLAKITVGVTLDDGVSKLIFTSIDNQHAQYTVQLHEGRNRQIRRTFEALGYEITKLHRTKFGDYSLGSLKAGSHIILN